MNPVQSAAFDYEMALANTLIARGDLASGYTHIERAHVIGQAFVLPHARSHWLMLKVEYRRRRPVAFIRQVVRLVLGVLGSAVGVVPVGNTGVPSWWPHFCLAYDGVAAAWLAWLLFSSKPNAVASGVKT